MEINRYRGSNDGAKIIMDLDPQIVAAIGEVLEQNLGLPRIARNLLPVQRDLEVMPRKQRRIDQQAQLHLCVGVSQRLVRLWFKDLEGTVGAEDGVGYFAG